MASEEMSFENVDDDGQRMPAYTISSSMSLRLRWAKNTLFSFKDNFSNFSCVWIFRIFFTASGILVTYSNRSLVCDKVCHMFELCSHCLGNLHNRVVYILPSVCFSLNELGVSLKYTRVVYILPSVCFSLNELGVSLKYTRVVYIFPSICFSLNELGVRLKYTRVVYIFPSVCFFLNELGVRLKYTRVVYIFPSVCLSLNELGVSLKYSRVVYSSHLSASLSMNWVSVWNIQGLYTSSHLSASLSMNWVSDWNIQGCLHPPICLLLSQWTGCRTEINKGCLHLPICLLLSQWTGCQSEIWAAAWQNQQNDLCAQQRLRSAWASTQSDQSSLSAWRNTGPLTTYCVHSEDSDQTEHLSLCWAHIILLVLSCGG